MEANTHWSFDPTHSGITFKVKHLMISNVKGSFGEFSGKVTTHENDFSTAKIELHINTSSINTDVADRDAHLKSADFFDSENYPHIIFVSDKLVPVGDDEFELKGMLTIKQTTLPVSLNVEFGGLMTDPWGNQKAGFAIEGKINRRDFGLNWNAALEAGGVLVGEDVKISCEIELTKQIVG